MTVYTLVTNSGTALTQGVLALGNCRALRMVERN